MIFCFTNAKSKSYLGLLSEKAVDNPFLTFDFGASPDLS